MFVDIMLKETKRHITINVKHAKIQIQCNKKIFNLILNFL